MFPDCKICTHIYTRISTMYGYSTWKTLYPLPLICMHDQKSITCSQEKLINYSWVQTFLSTWLKTNLLEWLCNYSASSVIQTSIIRHLDHPNAKFIKPHPHLRKPHAKWCFPIVKATRSAENVLIIEEKLDICKLMATDKSYTECYGSRRSTTAIRFSKKMDDMGMNKKGVWRSVKSKLDERCIFDLGR